MADFKDKTSFKFDCTNCGGEIHQGGEPVTVPVVIDGETVWHYACSKCMRDIKKYREEYEKRVAREELIANGYPVPERLKEDPNVPTPAKRPQSPTQAAADTTSQILDAIKGLGQQVASFGERLAAVEGKNGTEPKPAKTTRRR